MLKKITIIIIAFIAFIVYSNAQYFPDLSGKTYENLNYYDYKNAFENWAKDKDLSKVKGWKWYQRFLWQNENQVNADGSFPELRQSAKSYEEMMQLSKSKKERLQAQSGWVPLGPYTPGKSYDTISCHGNGRINCVAFHPTNPDVMWVGAPNGGVWKTDNSGKTWRPLTDNLPTISISDIAVDPKNGDILYIALGDFDTMGWIQNGNAMGVFKSTDAGETWNPTGLSYTSSTFNFSYIRKIIIHPENSNNLVAAGSRGIWKSTDAGETWKYILDTLLICDLKQNPKEPNILYAATRWFYNIFSTSGVIKSTDFGETWNRLNTGIPPTTLVTRTAVAVSPVNPNNVFALAVRASGNGFYGLYRSTDAGANWTSSSTIGDAPNIMGWYDGDKSDYSGQGTYDLTLLCDAKNEYQIYVGSVNVWMSTNAGIDWEIVTLWMKTFGSTIHADQHYSVYRPLDGYYYFCNDGGLFRTKQIRAGSKQWITDWIDRVNENKKPGCPAFRFPTQWESLTEGLANTELYRLGLCKNQAGYITGGSQDNSCFYLYNGEWLNYVTNYDGMETMVHPDNPDIIYGSSQFGRLCKSEDASVTQDCSLTDTITNNAKERGSWVTPFAMDPENPAIIYGGYKNLWRSENGGKDWKIIFKSDTSISLLDNINVISIAPTNHELIMFAKPNQRIQDNHKPHELWMSKDGGLNWKKIRNGLPLDSQSVTSIAISGDNPDDICLSFGSYISGSKIFRTKDGGETWTNISYNLPNNVYNTIVHQDNNPKNFLYAGTYRGVYYTNDDMTEWVLMNENLPNNTVNELEISYPDNKIIAATYGRGFWMADLIEGNVGIDGNVNFENLLIDILPNPSDGNLQMILNLNHNAVPVLNLEIIDILGRKVYNEIIKIDNSSLVHNLNLDLLSGQYFLKVSYANNMKVKKFIISK
jgi:photosystem II stability/assembly factor-like uncharacterized protein